MDFLINEAQLRIILMEQDQSKMTDDMKQLYSFTNNLVNRVTKKYGINIKMLMTWGTSVGGLVMPLDRYLKTGQFNLDDDQIFLILSGVAFMFFFDNSRVLSKIVKKIKEEGIEDEFKAAIRKGTELKKVFLGFLSSVNVTTNAFMDTIAYSFLIPIIADIHSIVMNTTNIKDASILIAERLLSSGVVVATSEILSASIKKIIKRFK